ncbi:DNA helicase/exodeoxyribonuclease V, beta subunit [Oceanospirillum multiglobuliferum]|uniref:RecBCD enzyme subunit RecB n=1 Tax=Oceanospirillum multiglobuliferum TaxID=64969 RepID=A0A1T4SGJ6_9GAMM|nr:exodeoxyribonuclease V subunit beta [Oceanospirillum multiglobuliferum]OPX54249.1 exodeoxyribonuclease V subunit beta [Oceanospirillum multiglobuliferum]SKA27424.1 DNA helicase/exodeoxyribonuclease V, beta subunit [Oceanospirillum multiglobuliferum]
MSQILNPLTFPLKGSALIEASAGTGKTYTLALLYLRLVLQHGQTLTGESDESSAFDKPLLPPNILVVTFTNAATQELRERIRLRLVEAAELLSQPEASTLTAEADSILLALKAALVQQGRALSAEARKLALAAEWMDEAAISTIHSWCYRILTEHAFDSGNAFGQELIQTDADYLQQAAEDYWRSFCLHLDENALVQVFEVFSTPNELIEKVKNLLPVVDQLNAGTISDLDQLFSQIKQEKAAILTPLKQQWREQNIAQQLEDLFNQAAKEKRIHAQKLNSSHRGGVIDKLKQWQNSEAEQTGINAESTSFQRMAGLDLSVWKNEADADSQHHCCLALRDLEQQLAQLPRAKQPLLIHAAQWLAERIEQEKLRQQQLYHNDLLVRLDRALQHPTRGDALASSIRRKFPVALVDEFQDTDPVQYRIFNRIYQVQAPLPETGFFMIGDPKQAIYAFRGADIYTYLAARQDAQRHFTLGTNFRSSPALIQQVNRTFMQGEALDKGAFLFKQPEDNPVPFLAVQAGKKGLTGLQIEGQTQSAQQAWLIDTDKVMDYRQQSAEVAANEIARLLVLGQRNLATLPDEYNPEQRAPVMPKDIAVLVNSGNEAQIIAEALYQRGIASVYLSDRSSVYQSAAAAELLLLLRAVANPLDDRRLKQALACALAGYSVLNLERLNCDELYWEAQIERFVQLQKIWQYQGVLALIYQLIERFQIAQRLLLQRGGERHLTDLLHLGELLQQASEQFEGEQALIRYFEEAQLNPDEHNESQQQRLESDRELVKIVTIHKSKGLEYPLVFLPFICNYRQETGKYLPVKTHNEQGELAVHLSLSTDILQKADEERLAEDLRKLYVALTRARYGNWLGMACLEQLSQSAIGYILGIKTAPTIDDLSTQSCLQLITPSTEHFHYQAPQEARLDAARTSQLKRLTPWWIASYSAIRYGQKSAEVVSDKRFDQPLMEEESASQATAREEPSTAEKPIPAALMMPPLSAQTRSLHQFPAGSKYGTFLHSLLEWAAGQTFLHHEQNGQGSQSGQKRYKGFAATAHPDFQKERLDMLGKRCNLRQLQDWVYPLNNWLQDFIRQPWQLNALPEIDGTVPSFALADLKPSQIHIEMEFLLQSRFVQSTELDALVIDNTLAKAPRPMAQPSLLNGLLKGFIDLVLEHQGRYYVVDWKSNKLGEDDQAYTESAMRNAMLDHRYDLQYVLYLLALHRQLKARLPNYDYDLHVGGAVYVFLRGNQSPSQGLFMDRPSKAFIEQLDKLFSAEQSCQQPAQEAV